MLARKVGCDFDNSFRVSSDSFFFFTLCHLRGHEDCVEHDPSHRADAPALSRCFTYPVGNLSCVHTHTNIGHLGRYKLSSVSKIHFAWFLVGGRVYVVSCF